MKRFLSLLLCSALAVSLLAACGGSSSQEGSSESTATETSAAETSTGSGSTSTSDDALQVAWTNDVETLDVHLTTNDYEIPLNVYDRLFEIQLNDDGSTELVNSVCEDYIVSDDGLTYSFTLRNDVYFSDGTQLTADDVAFSLIRLLALDTSVQTDFAACILGADTLIETEGYSYNDTCEGIEVVDTTHINITLAYAFAGFLYELATPAGCIYSQAAVEAAGDSFGTDYTYAIGSGPYVITSWTRESGMTLALNEYYWGETPDFTEVNIQIIPDSSTLSMMFQNGEIDILDCDLLDSAVVSATYKTDAYADKLVTANRLGTSYMALNENDENLSNVSVRKAIQMAIDRESILASIFDGDGTIPDGIYPEGLIGYTEDNQGWLEYDPEAAEQLLIDAGYTKDSNGYYFSMVIANDNDNSTSRQNVIQIIAEELQAIGINCTIENYDHATWLDMRNAGEITAYVSTWTADYNDPDNFIYTFFGTEANTLARSLNYSNTEVMERIQAARAIVDDEERLAEYAALEYQIVAEEAAWVPLYSNSHLFVLSERVESFVPHWAGYSDFYFATVERAD
ncbi:MAG: ABC transporter substrate-binding protein [Oscillospiraceae bacterium]|nr:ABC transporter substrate-binding protein [Oscillospiraceae bacterium]